MEITKQNYQHIIPFTNLGSRKTTEKHDYKATIYIGVNPGQNIGILDLRNFLNDGQVETVWNACLAGVTGVGFSIESGDVNPKTANFIKEMVRSYDSPTIISAMMDAVAFGFFPVEINWNTAAKKWRAVDFVPKPPK